MEIVKKKIEELNPAKYNPRKALKSNSPEYKKLKQSIETFGLVDPIIVNVRNNTIVGGHQRFKVLKDLGYDEIDCVIVNLDENEEKALNIALNKIKGQWDEMKLQEVLLDLQEVDFNIELTGFELQDVIPEDEYKQKVEEQQAIDDLKENERVRTVDTYNLSLYDPYDAVGYYDMPIIHGASVDDVPDELIGFNYMKTTQNKNCGIHFYLDDYQFERLWNNPEAYIDELKQFDCVFTPDFSLYMDMPIAMKVWNTYRSRLLGYYWEQNGIKVIPTISWAEDLTFDFCFDGIQQGAVVTVSTIGVKRDQAAYEIWKAGMDAMIEAINPSMILVYGGVLEYDYGNIPVRYYDNRVTEKMKGIKR